MNASINQEKSNKSISDLAEWMYPIALGVAARATKTLLLTYASAEDFAADAAWTSATKLVGSELTEEEAAGYLYAALRNKAIDHARREGRAPFIVVEDGVAENCVGSEDLTMRSIDSRDLLNTVIDRTRESLSGLLLETFETMIAFQADLIEIGGDMGTMTESVAEVLGVTNTTARWRIWQIRKVLRENFPALA